MLLQDTAASAICSTLSHGEDVGGPMVIEATRELVDDQMLSAGDHPVACFSPTNEPGGHMLSTETGVLRRLRLGTTVGAA